MPNYVLLSTLTTERRQTMHSHPERPEEVNKEIAAQLSVDLGSRGTVNIVTLPAIDIADLQRKLQGPDQIGRPD